MPELAIVGLSAKVQQGKDHMAKIIFVRRGFYRIAFADHLKMQLIAHGEMTWEEAYVTKPQWVRERLQQHGTEETRDVIDTEFWIKALESWVQTVHNYHRISRFIIPDVRFFNELQWVHDNDGIVIRLDSDRKSEEISEDQKAHRSEVLLDRYEFPHRVENFEGSDELDAELAVLTLVDMYLATGANDGKIF